jgi:hypothetical protein
MTQPSVFIGSSAEGKDFARAAREALDGDAEVTVWDEEFADVGHLFIETLVARAPRFDSRS